MRIVYLTGNNHGHIGHAPLSDMRDARILHAQGRAFSVSVFMGWETMVIGKRSNELATVRLVSNADVEKIGLAEAELASATAARKGAETREREAERRLADVLSNVYAQGERITVHQVEEWQRSYQAAKPIKTVTLSGNMQYRCECGNTNDENTEGFEPCDRDGTVVIPTPALWPEPLYLCNRCGQIVRDA